MADASTVCMDVDGTYDGTFYVFFISMLTFLKGIVPEETGNVIGEFRRVGLFRGFTDVDKTLLLLPFYRQESFPCTSYDPIKKRHTISIV